MTASFFQYKTNQVLWKSNTKRVEIVFIFLKYYLVQPPDTTEKMFIHLLDYEFVTHDSRKKVTYFKAWTKYRSKVITEPYELH
jgi:hypothetical protein